VQDAKRRAAFDEIVESIRTALGGDTFRTLRATGAALPLAQSLAPELETTSEPNPLPDPVAEPRAELLNLLTRRERDVLALLVQRLTNVEIAHALFVSPRTVETHVQSIIGKLGVKSRREAAVVAIRYDLVST
jgi:DNA-binding NarL/FixJ family response regulator